MLTAEQKAEAKSNYMSIVNRPVDVANLLPNDLKVKIKQLHAKIVRLESEKYDLSQRQSRQDYDLKELEDRQSQRARNKALALGVEVEQAESGKVRPPKVEKFDFFK
jgi:troponin T